MSLTQQYAVREVIIDRMLHSEQGATLKELMAACNDALIADGRKGVRSLNTISADITNISNRYNQEIEEIKESYDHRIIRYRYANRNFSIYNIGLAENDSKLLNSVVGIMSQFQGLPVSGWLAETDLRIRSSIRNSGRSAVVGFDTYPEYVGNRNLLPLFEAITQRQTLEIEYWDWTKKGKVVMKIWPYYLKQSGHLWYLMAGNVRNDKLECLGLDRIESIKPIERKYHDCKVDLQRYFDERIGATASSENKEKRTIRFWASVQVWPYLVQSPMHSSQKLIDYTFDDGALFEIEVCYTREMLQELQRYGSDLIVLEPADLRESLARDAAQTLRNYGYPGIDIDTVADVIPAPEDALTLQETTSEIINDKNNKTMKVLNLIIKQTFFDQILSGEKTQEFREIKPTTYKRYIELDEDGNDKEDENGNSIPIHYDAIRFFVGYNPDRDSALVEVKGAYTEIFTDDNGEWIWYEAGGKNWLLQQVVYNLGKVLETDLHPKK